SGEASDLNGWMEHEGLLNHWGNCGLVGWMTILKKEKLKSQFLEAEVPVLALVPFGKPFIHLSLVLRRRDNDLVTRLPVCRGGNAVFVGGLQGFYEANYLWHVPPCRERIVDHGPQDTFVIDEKYCPDCSRAALARVDHPILFGNIHVKVGDDGERNIDSHLLFHVPYPGKM